MSIKVTHTPTQSRDSGGGPGLRGGASRRVGSRDAVLVALITVAMEVRLGGPRLCRGTPWSLVGRGPVRRVLKNEEGIIEPGRTCPGNTGDFCRGACTAGGRVRETECSVRRFSRGLQEERQGQGTPELRPEGRGRPRWEEGETQPPGPPRGGARPCPVPPSPARRG